MEENKDNYYLLTDFNEDGVARTDVEVPSASSDLATEIHSHLKVLKANLPVVMRNGLPAPSTNVEGWLWIHKNEGKWKKRWFVWRYSDLHEQWNLYAYTNPENAVRALSR